VHSFAHTILPVAGQGARADPGPRRARGFTLVELLIALAMVSLITVLLFSGLRLGSRSWDAVEASADRTGALRLAHGFLLRTLIQARAASLVFDGAMLPVFAGDAERLEYVAPLSEHVGVPGLYVLRLQVEGSGDRRNLILTRWLIHPEVLEGTDEIPAWEPLKEDSQMSLGSMPPDQDAAAGAFGRTLLLEGVAGLELSYFGVTEGESDPEWHDEWMEQATPPSLLRIHLTTSEQTWPDLIVALPAPPG
jgi:general secretion pathway protein J